MKYCLFKLYYLLGYIHPQRWSKFKYTHRHMQTYTYLYVYKYMYMHIYTYLYACMYIHVYNTQYMMFLHNLVLDCLIFLKVEIFAWYLAFLGWQFCVFCTTFWLYLNQRRLSQVFIYKVHSIWDGEKWDERRMWGNCQELGLWIGQGK